MNRRFLLAVIAFLLTAGVLRSQIATDALGVHNLGLGNGSPITGARPDSCAYCHAAHSGLNTGLWNQKLTTQVYTLYSSNTQKNTASQPVLASDSNHCLSCHDGSVAVGTTVAYGNVTTHGSMYSSDVFGSNMQTSHPFSLAVPLKDNIYLAASLASNGTTADTTHAVKLIGGNVECTSCHNPHVQSIDLISKNFLVKNNADGQLCLACHDPARTSNAQVNPLADWTTSIHALSTAKLSAQAGVGNYTTVGADACIACHAPHNAGSSTRLLRGQNEQDCIACHNGGSNVSPLATYTNVFSEYSSPKIGHPIPNSSNPHDASEAALLNNNRHATCVDCHNAHGSQQVGVFPDPPLIRISQKNIAGINASDGTSVLAPAVNQYENCLRCHGTSSGKQILASFGYFPIRAVSTGDPLNLIPQFASTATSSHPVMHPRSSALPQPSLRSYMLNLDGVTQGRSMGTQILCTDCHNSDDNREFGGTGPNGPHGSKWTHILEREYEFSQAAAPGQLINTLYPNPDLTSTGPYALCAKCHDLATVATSTASWAEHKNHINDGSSCSVCHTSHGMGSTSATVSGERLVNFDMNVVATNNGTVNYTRTTDSCNLVCHGVTHTPSTSGIGTTTSVIRRTSIGSTGSNTVVRR
ncbi:MAG: cytochrome c3 family protein [Terracidiphilus sp.]|nr:cytochrome c3 family protein [Terracidiphilus sp.]